MQDIGVNQFERLVDELRERMANYRRLDRIGQIHNFCDDLIADVSVAFDSAFKHLQNMQESMLAEISQYRKELIEAQEIAAANNPSSYYAHQSAFEVELPNLLKLKQDFFKLSQETRCLEAKCIASQEKQLKAKEAELRREAFGGRYMRFKPNRFFSMLKDHVGCFEFTGEIIEPTGRISLQFESNEFAFDCEGFRQIAFLSEDCFVTFCFNRNVSIWKCGDEITLLEKLPDNATSLAILPNGNIVIGRFDGQLRIYDMSKPLQTKRTREFVVLEQNEKRILSKIVSLLVLPNGNLASSDFNGRIDIWDVRMAGTDQALLFSFHTRRTRLMGALSNGFLVTCDVQLHDPCTLELWDLKSAQPLRVIDTKQVFVMSLLVLPNDQVVISNRYSQIKIFDLIEATLIRLIDLSIRNSPGIWTLVHLPNGYLMTADATEQFKFFNLETGELVQSVPTNHYTQVHAIAFSPSGKRMVSAEIDCGIQTWTFEIVSDS